MTYRQTTKAGISISQQLTDQHRPDITGNSALTYHISLNAVSSISLSGFNVHRGKYSGHYTNIL